MVIKTVYNFVDSNLGGEISSKKRGQQKKRGQFWKLFCLGREPMAYLGERRKRGLPVGPGVGETTN